MDRYRNKKTGNEVFAIQWKRGGLKQVDIFCHELGEIKPVIKLGAYNDGDYIDTFKGKVLVSVNDYIIKENDVGFYPMNESNFHEEFELV